jgi:hypothetical protein
MSLRNHKLSRLVVGCIFATAVCGCQAPWTAAPSFSRMGAADHALPRNDIAPRVAGSASANSLVADSHAPLPAAGKPADNDQAMVAVLQEVQRAGATDPAAQKMLLDQLQRSKPELWPLVVQHFQSSQNYHDQLAAATVNDTSARERAATSVAWHTSPSNAAAAALSSTAPASGKIGELVDPRAVPGESSANQAVAAATPANMSPPLDRDTIALAAAAAKMPQPLATDPAARPIAAAKASSTLPSAGAPTPQADVSPAAKQAIYEAAVDSASGVKQTLATVPVDQANTRGASPATAPPILSAISAADPGSQDWRKDIDEAIKDLQGRLSDAPQTTAEVHQQVSLRLLELLAGHTEDALKPIPQISHEEQDYWSGQVYALATYLDHHSQPDDKRRAAASVAHLDEAVGHLRELGSLALRNLTFCKNIYDYGSYEPYDEPQFSPGQQVLLYVEVENYHSDSTDKGFCTSLGTSYEVFDDHGKRLEGGDFPDVEDCCRSRRRDFHIQYGLAIPKKLGPGKYRLDLDMKDRRGDKLGHASIDFEIRGGKS